MLKRYFLLSKDGKQDLMCAESSSIEKIERVISVVKADGFEVRPISRREYEAVSKRMDEEEEL